MTNIDDKKKQEQQSTSTPTDPSTTRPLLKSAPPPWHSVATIVAILAICIPNLPYLFDQDINDDTDPATMKTFTNRVFPQWVSLERLIAFRTACFLLGLGVSIQAVFFSPGWEQKIHYLPKSKLRITNVPMRGWRTQLPYTSFSWNLLTCSFGLNAYIARIGLLQQQQEDYDLITVSPQLLRIALLMYETAAPTALLVAFVVRYGIWPNILRQGGSTATLKHWRTLLWHNANVVMATTELALAGGLPVLLSHVAVSPLYGVAYILLSWSLVHFWKPEEGPQFIYYFFDTTLGSTATIALLMLLVIMMTFYGIFVGAAHGLEIVTSFASSALLQLLIHVLFVVLICGLVCRVRD